MSRAPKKRLRSKRRVAFDDPEAMCRAALLGLGVTLIAVPHALPHLESGALVRLAPQWYSDADRSRFTTPRARCCPPKRASSSTSSRTHSGATSRRKICRQYRLDHGICIQHLEFDLERLSCLLKNWHELNVCSGSIRCRFGRDRLSTNVRFASIPTVNSGLWDLSRCANSCHHDSYHSMISSAMSWTAPGTVNPSVFAVPRLRTSSNLVA